MASTEVKMFKGGAVQRGIVLQLLFCHSLIVAVTLLTAGRVLFIFAACLLSFLLLLTIPYRLHIIEMMLARLARGLPLEPQSLRLCWPFTRLFVLVNMLAQQTGQQIQVEERNVAYRDQLLQQVSKTATQEERNRLARDLHDSIKQQIFSIVVSAAAVKARWEHNPASVGKVIDDIERTAQEAQVEMQALLQQLRPSALENVGLIESLRMQCQALGYRTGAEVTAELGNLPPDELFPIGAQEMIFRIVQEGFANIARHARASQVWLSLQQKGDTLLVEIGDNGQGFDLAQANERPNSYGGMGLSNVRERASALGGTLSLWSRPEQGTTLHLYIPLVNPQVQAEKQEHANREFVSAVRKTRLVLRIGMVAAELAAALILLYTPLPIALWLVGFCLMLALVSWLWAQQYRFHVSLNVGREQAQQLVLLAGSYGLLSGILLLLAFYSSYFLFLSNTGELRLGVFAGWIVPIFSTVCLAATLVTYLAYTRNLSRFYKILSRTALQEQVRRQLQQLLVDWIAWVLVFSLTLVLLNTLPPLWAGEPVVEMSFALLVIWFLTILIKSLRTARWQQRLARQEQKGDVV